MLRAVIIEDQVVHAIRLKELLYLWSKPSVPIDIQVFNNAEDFWAYYVKGCEINIIYFDIELDGNEDGLSLAKKVRARGYRNIIVFTTGYVEHAIKGYEVNAYRYYVKPVELRDVKESMNYVMNKIAGTSFQFKYHGETIRIPWNNIIYIESHGHYIDIHTTNKSSPMTIKMSLAMIMSKSPACIVRCQRSFVLNSKHIIKRAGNRLTMSNNKTIDIAPSKSKVVKDALSRLERNENGVP